MTLQEFFNLLSNNPLLILSYFLIIPFTALLAGIMGKGEGHMSPWKYLYSTLIYLVSIPGIFAVTLSVYFFLFERRSVLQTDIYTQILPVLSMALTLWLISRNVELKQIPGFGKLSGLLLIIAAALMLMWIFDRLRILVFTMMPFYYVIFLFLGLFLLLRYGWYQMVEKEQEL
jgi:hypothetical protein